MMFSSDDLAAFWSAPWSVPIRSACRWLAPEAQTRTAPEPKPPTWLRPLCLQRWVGQTVLARLAWMQSHPQAALYRYSGSSDERDPSIPCWIEKGTISYDWHELHFLEEAAICLRWEIEVERLLRTCEAPPALLGQDTWARAVLRICEHLTQLYTELKRRQGARRARYLLRERLRHYITWQRERQAA